MKKVWVIKIIGFIFIFVIVFLLMNLVTGNCQNSKMHYLIQEYYLPDSIKSLIGKSKVDTFNEIKIDKNYSGNWTHWSREGVVLFKGTFKNGKAIGKHEYWYESGKKKREAFYVDHILVGKVFTWYENGHLESVGNWKDGLPHGCHERWDENGQKFFVHNFVNGIKSGIWEEWHVNGQKAFVKEYLNDLEIGAWESWYENGQKKDESNWANGMLILSENWSKNGDILSKTSYIEDKMQYRIELFSDNKLKEVKFVDSIK